MANVLVIQQFKTTIPLVKPKPIRASKVVAHVKVGKSIVVHVTKGDSEPPLAQRRQRHGLAIDNKPGFTGNIVKRAVALVEVKPVRLRQFTQSAGVRDCEAPLPFRLERGLAVDSGHRPLLATARVLKTRGRIGKVHPVDVVRHVQIEIPVTIHIGESHRGRRAGRVQTRVFNRSKPAVAVVDEQSRANLHTVDQQVVVAVAINIDQGCPGADGIRQRVGTRHRLELKPSPVQVQCVRALNIAEEHIRQVIPVHVASGNAGPVVRHHVFVILETGQPVRESDATLGCGDCRESLAPLRGRRHGSSPGRIRLAKRMVDCQTKQQRYRAWPSASAASKVTE